MDFVCKLYGNTYAVHVTVALVGVATLNLALPAPLAIGRRTPSNRYEITQKLCLRFCVILLRGFPLRLITWVFLRQIKFDTAHHRTSETIYYYQNLPAVVIIVSPSIIFKSVRLFQQFISVNKRIYTKYIQRTQIFYSLIRVNKHVFIFLKITLIQKHTICTNDLLRVN